VRSYVLVKNKTKYYDDEIDLVEIIKKLWKEKVLIIGLSMLFGIIAYGYGITIPKKFEASVKLNQPSIIEFRKFENVFNLFGKKNEEFESIDKFRIDFFNNFKNEVFSISNFAKFLRINKDAELFIQNLKDKEVSLEQYLTNGHFREKQVNLRIKNQTEVIPELIFTYTKEIKGYDVLNQYIPYQANLSKQQIFKEIENNLQEKLKNNNQAKRLYIENRKNNLETEITQLNLNLKEYISKQTRALENKLFEFEQALKTAKSINLEDWIPTSILKGNSGSILNEPGALFYKGAKVLASEIENIKSDLKNLDKTDKYNEIISSLEQAKNQLLNLDQTEAYNKILNNEANLEKNINLLKQINFNWNPILQQSIEPQKHIYPKKSIFVLVGLFLGFFTSLLIIFFRSQVSK